MHRMRPFTCLMKSGLKANVGGITNLFLLYKFIIYPNFFLFHHSLPGITLQTSSLSYRNQVIPQVYNSNRISHKDAFEMITKGSKLQRKNIPGLTYHPDEAPTGCCDFLKNTASILSLGANDGSTVCQFPRERWMGRLLFKCLHGWWIGGLSRACEWFFLAAAASWSQGAGGLFGCWLEEQALLWLFVC